MSNKPPTLEQCLEWLKALDEGATIWDTELKYISRLIDAVEQLVDEINVANAAHNRK